MFIDVDPNVGSSRILTDCLDLNPFDGSSTLAWISFDLKKANYLNLTNLGDSGFMILRKNTKKNGLYEKIYRSLD
jgi:hypothetical protein